MEYSVVHNQIKAFLPLLWDDAIVERYRRRGPNRALGVAANATEKQAARGWRERGCNRSRQTLPHHLLLFC